MICNVHSSALNCISYYCDTVKLRLFTMLLIDIKSERGACEL